jgi:H+/Cl- antiporter ClcA
VQVAGAVILAALVLCTLAGLGLGALIGAAGPMAALGAAVGLPIGFWLVYRLYKGA